MPLATKVPKSRDFGEGSWTERGESLCSRDPSCPRGVQVGCPFPKEEKKKKEKWNQPENKMPLHFLGLLLQDALKLGRDGEPRAFFCGKGLLETSAAAGTRPCPSTCAQRGPRDTPGAVMVDRKDWLVQLLRKQTWISAAIPESIWGRRTSVSTQLLCCFDSFLKRHVDERSFLKLRCLSRATSPLFFLSPLPGFTFSGMAEVWGKMR